MKKTLSAIAATAVLAGCCQSTAVKFTLTGSDPLFENGKYIYVQDENGKTGDSVQIADHGFTIKGERPYPEQAYLSIDREQIGSDFFLEDGTIRIERHGDTAEDFIYTGTPRNDRYNAILRQNEALYDSGRPALQIKQAQDSLLRAAVAQNPNILGLTLLKDDLLYTLSAPEIRQFADAFPESFQRHPYMLELRKFVENLRADIGKPSTSRDRHPAETPFRSPPRSESPATVTCCSISAPVGAGTAGQSFRTSLRSTANTTTGASTFSASPTIQTTNSGWNVSKPTTCAGRRSLPDTAYLRVRHRRGKTIA